MKKIMAVLLIYMTVPVFNSCKKDIQPGRDIDLPAYTGSLTFVTFWTQDGVYVPVKNADPITISINNQTQILTGYTYGAREDCSMPDYKVRFSVNPGIYSWKAVRGIDTAKGIVNAQLNTCNLQEIKF
jgi:hypothetical protein